MDIEKITSGNMQIMKKRHRLRYVVGKAQELLFLEDDKLRHNVKAEELEVDFRLFTLALKNLIDNALKHSSDGQVRLVVEEGGILSEEPLEFYLEPFAKEAGSRTGFGLGLFIVHHIARAHGVTLSYSYEKGESRFALPLPGFRPSVV